MLGQVLYKQNLTFMRTEFEDLEIQENGVKLSSVIFHFN